MKRKHKIYSRPKRPFNKERITEENEIRKEFGLKTKTEIWKIESRVKEMRERAKELISASPEKQQELFARLKKRGFNVNTISDVLSLNKIDYMKRRLQTILVIKKLASTVKGARQLIVHRKVMVNGEVVDSPSYIVPTEYENRISLKIKTNKPKAEKPIEKQESEILQNKISREISQ